MRAPVTSVGVEAEGEERIFVEPNYGKESVPGQKAQGGQQKQN